MVTAFFPSPLNMHSNTFASWMLPPWCQRGRPRQGGGHAANWKQAWGKWCMAASDCKKKRRNPPPNFLWRPHLIRLPEPDGDVFFATSRHRPRRWIRLNLNVNQCCHWRPNIGGHSGNVMSNKVLLLKMKSRNFYEREWYSVLPDYGYLKPL